MIGVNTGVQNAGQNVSAIGGALVSPDGLNSPSRPLRRHCVRGHRCYQACRHGPRQIQNPWVTRRFPQVLWVQIFHAHFRFGRHVPGHRRHPTVRRHSANALRTFEPASPPSRIGIFQNDVACHDITPLRVGLAPLDDTKRKKVTVPFSLTTSGGGTENECVLGGVQSVRGCGDRYLTRRGRRGQFSWGYGERACEEMKRVSNLVPYRLLCKLRNQRGWLVWNVGPNENHSLLRPQSKATGSTRDSG